MRRNPQVEATRLQKGGGPPFLHTGLDPRISCHVELSPGPLGWGQGRGLGAHQPHIPVTQPLASVPGDQCPWPYVVKPSTLHSRNELCPRGVLGRPRKRQCWPARRPEKEHPCEAVTPITAPGRRGSGTWAPGGGGGTRTGGDCAWFVPSYPHSVFDSRAQTSKEVRVCSPPTPRYKKGSDLQKYPRPTLCRAPPDT